MNIRLLGAIILVIGALLGIYGVDQIGRIKSTRADTSSADFYRRASGLPPISTLPANYDLDRNEERMQTLMIAGWVIAALGLALTIAAKRQPSDGGSGAR